MHLIKLVNTADYLISLNLEQSSVLCKNDNVFINHFKIIYTVK